MEQRQHAVDADVAALLDEGLARLGARRRRRRAAGHAESPEMLARWNRTMNLTAVADPLRAVIVHVLDSLSVAPHLAGPRVIDVGTGAGFPGLPLAFLRPDLDFTLLDSRDRKLRFVSEVLRATGTANVTLAQERVERYFPADKFDTLLARAFSSLADLVRLAGTSSRPAPGCLP
ncbi:MAG: 16S rRNA (guanine(527)-N(7))-methyltransferase RsmG [Gammaproteobacteria bacterium]|nr:16S rRNA (guanine(527)-N(7))-methyltransferase RsmG [Gammaproteobacteria bacterium]